VIVPGYSVLTPYCSQQEEGKIELGVGIIRYKTKMSTPRVGVCTKWLATMEKGYPVFSSISRGSMRLPSDPSTPLILIGPGLGAVPMRSFLQERISHGAYSRLSAFFCD
jgi:sulfite reductase alpha subunit-like flavoprotein